MEKVSSICMKGTSFLLALAAYFHSGSLMVAVAVFAVTYVFMVVVEEEEK